MEDHVQQVSTSIKGPSQPVCFAGVESCGGHFHWVANSHVDSVTPFRSMILSYQRSPYLINIQLRRRFVGYFIGILTLSVVRDGERY